jgi:hypothetical protein
MAASSIPMRIKLPRGRSLEGPLMAGFEKERDRVELRPRLGINQAK